MAMWRDECICPMCGAVADESDHVFGRGHPTILLPEHWMLRMSLCQLCHYGKHHGGGFDKVRQVKKLKSANEVFCGEGSEICYLALNKSLVLRMAYDTGKAISFINDWMARNG